eukprot:NODE_612_length_5407_cov_0.901093.p5 type:complete len:134 gc:universal NODE_612_length_5407_cov_0.901093:885-1286(+)
MSRTANLPRGGKSLKLSTHIGFCGIILTIAASPDLTNFGLSSIFLPLRLSIFSNNWSNRQAMCAVWQSKTGEYPGPICPGWFNTITCAVKSAASFAGSFLLSLATNPLFNSLTLTFLTLNPTLSPGLPCGNCS